MRQCPEILESFHLEVLTGRTWVRENGRTGPLQQCSQRPVVLRTHSLEISLTKGSPSFYCRLPEYHEQRLSH